MNKRILKQVCRFLQSESDNEAHFSHFWDNTKDFYPEEQSKTKVKQWLQEQPERFEFIAGKDGNPCSKIRLRTPAGDTTTNPETTFSEDKEITAKLTDAISKQDDGQLLFARLCAQKSDFFPSQLLDKKFIRKWLGNHEDYFEMVMDENGGLCSVRISEKASARAAKGRGKRKPVKEVASVDRVQETSSLLDKITRFIEQSGGSVLFNTLIKQKGIFPECSENSFIRSFLANFPSQMQLVNSFSGEMVVLITQRPALRVPTAQPKVQRETRGEIEIISADKLINFICGNGGIVSFVAILKEAGELIHPGITNNESLFKWLLSNHSHFDVLPSSEGTPHGQVKVKLNIQPRFCHSYVTEKKCSKPNCGHLHVCKAFISGQHHSQGICNQSHNIRDGHNRIIIDKSDVLRRYDDNVVNQMLRKSCFPRVCAEFNKNKQAVCPRNDKCNFLHVCGDFVLNECPGCSLPHNIADDSHNIKLLKKYALLPSKKMSVEMVKTNIAYVRHQTPGGGVESRTLQPLMKLHSHVPKLSGFHSEKQAKNKRRTRPRRSRGNKTSSSSDKVDSKLSECSTSDSESNSSSTHKPTLPCNFQQTSLEVGSIEQSNLNASFSGHEKVENWMSSGGGYAAQANQPLRERSQSLSSSEGSAQSSVVSSHNSLQLTELHKKVFMRLLEKYNGSALFSQISKDHELFPAYFDVSKWFEDHSNTFILQFNGRRQVEKVNVFSHKCRLCLDYSKKGCSNQDCRYFHVCRNLIEGNCPGGTNCKLNHDKSDQVKQVAKRIHLEELTDTQLWKVLKLSTPSVCDFHNKGGCNRGVNCPNVHMCKKFARNQRCPAKSGCSFGHLSALETPQTKKLLDQYKLSNQKSLYICKMLLVFNERRSDATITKGDSKGKTTKVIEKEQPKICSQFLTGQCSLNGKKCKDMHYIMMPYLWQFQLTSNPSSKWCRFDASDCENIERSFCDVNCTAAELSMATKITSQSSSPNSSVRLDFQSMSGSCSQHPSGDEIIKFDLRRLESNSSKVTGDGDWFDSRWMWYKQDDYCKWINYDVNLASALEESYLHGTIQIDGTSLRRRPAVFVSRSEVQERKRGSTEAPVSEMSSMMRDIVETKNVVKSNQSSSTTPCPAGDARAAPLTSVQCYRVKVECGTQDYHTIEKLLRGSVGEQELDINNLEKIKNDSLWNKYISKKKEMADELDPGESVNERHLFTPCRYDDVERIMADNVRVSRLDLPELLGPGHYFTSDASLCLKWCTVNSAQSRFLLVCQVLLGTYTQSSPSNPARPRRENGKFYDSLVDRIAEPTVFVVSDVDQCYPAYIIDFSYASAVPGESIERPLSFDPHDAGRVSGTQTRHESLLSPASPSYLGYPGQIGQNQRPDMVNHPPSYPGVVPQQLPPSVVSAASAGREPLSDQYRYSSVSPQRFPSVVTAAPTGSHLLSDEHGYPSVPSFAPGGHVEDCVKVPPPYSERPASSAARPVVPSGPPPNYSRYQPPAGFAYPRAAFCADDTTTAGIVHPTTDARPRGTPAERSGRSDVMKKEKDCVVM